MKFSAVSLGLSVALCLASVTRTAAAAADVDHDETKSAVPESEARPKNLRGAGDRKLKNLFDDDDGKPSPDTTPRRELSGRVIVSRKTEKKLKKEGKTPNEIAAIRSQGMSEIKKNKVVFESGGEGDFQVVEIGKGKEAAYIRRLMKGPKGDAFEFAEPDYIEYPIATVPTDGSQLAYQYHHTNMQSFDAWDITTGSADVTVAICDTGIDLNHPDLANRLEGYQATTQTWEDNGGDVSAVHPHGTNCAGCAAAIGNNGVGLSGVGWSFKHRPGRVSDDPGGSASSAVLADCARKMCALSDVKAVGVSYSGVEGQARREAATYCKTQGALMVNAAGNDGRDLSSFGEADADDLIVAGASTSSDSKSGFSAYGRFVDVWAPGSSVWTTTTNSGYQAVSGTSFSCPLVAGLIALIWSANPSLTPDEVETILKSSTDNVGIQGPYNTPYGRVNSFKAVQAAASGTLSPTPPPTPPPTRASCLTGGELEIDILTDNYPAETTWTLTDTCTNQQVAIGGPYSSSGTTYNYYNCGTLTAYSFTINDSVGDGICCGYGSGSYEVKYKGVVVASGGAFGTTATDTFGSCDAGPPATPPPTNASTPPPSPPPTPDPTPNPTTPSPTTPNPTTAQPTTPPPTTTQPTTAPPTTAPPTTAQPTPNPTTAQPTPNPTPNPTTPSPTTPSPTPLPTTAQPTPNPTPVPTTPHPTPCSGMEIKVDILTDNYPAETSYTLTNNCDSSVVIDDGPGYPMTAATSYSDTYCLPSAEYTFTLSDSWGDGICCGYGSGNYAVSSDGTQVASGGDFGASESTTFGSCGGGPSPTPPPTSLVTPPPTAPPTPLPTVPLPPPPSGPVVAVFDTSLGAPKCSTVGSSCTSGLLLDGAASNREPNPSNTLDSCADGPNGSYHSDESVDKITVIAVGGGQLEAGAIAQINAQVWAWLDGSYDFADFYYASNVGQSPTWNFIGSIIPGGGGQRTLAVQYTLPDSALQAVRVQFRYQGARGGGCAAGTTSYYDVDDLVFAVAPASVAVTGVGKKPARVAPPKPLQSSHCADIGVSERKRCEAVPVCEWHNGKDKGCYPKA